MRFSYRCVSLATVASNGNVVAAGIVLQPGCRTVNALNRNVPATRSAPTRTGRPSTFRTAPNAKQETKAAPPFIKNPRRRRKTNPAPKRCRVRAIAGAGDGNRTRVISLEGWGSTIELRPQYGRDDRIRTCGIVLPKHARYQTAPRPDVQSKHYRGFSSSGQRPVRATPRNARGVHESLGRIL